MSKDQNEEINNYITLSRRVFASPLWSDKDRPRTPFEAWLWLIKEARFEMGQQKLLLGGKWVTWGRGQLPGSVRHLAVQWKWTIGKVQRFLSKLEDEQMISREVEASSGQSIITLINYDRYNFSKNSKRYSKQDRQSIDNVKVKGMDDTLNDTVNDTGTPVRPIHPRYNTNTVNTGNNNTGFLGASAQKENAEYLDQFRTLNDWMEKKAPRVLKMKEQLTVEQFVKLKEQFGSRAMGSMFEKMHNYKPLLDKNVSVYRTFLNWITREKDFNHQPEPPENTENAKLKAAIQRAKGR
ncbi:MAG: hypothetical protein ACREHG_02805 [Candidatus Saccharimonadales bacterium]